MAFQCKHCGKCCKKLFGFKATEEDVKRWKKEYRKDILKWVFIFEHEGKFIFADFGVNRKTGYEPTKCPFLEKRQNMFFCKIHDTKPSICKNFTCENYKWKE